MKMNEINYDIVVKYTHVYYTIHKTIQTAL